MTDNEKVSSEFAKMQVKVFMTVENELRRIVDVLAGEGMSTADMVKNGVVPENIVTTLYGASIAYIASSAYSEEDPDRFNKSKVRVDEALAVTMKMTMPAPEQYHVDRTSEEVTVHKAAVTTH